jgi:hypothetical protein
MRRSTSAEAHEVDDIRDRGEPTSPLAVSSTNRITSATIHAAPACAYTTIRWLPQAAAVRTQAMVTASAGEGAAMSAPTLFGAQEYCNTHATATTATVPLPRRRAGG